MKPYAIQDLIDVQELAQIQDYMAKAIGFAAVITDPEGKPITPPSHFSKACEMFHRPIAGTLCEASHKALGKESLQQGGVVIRSCDHAGLMDAAVSITPNGRPIGVFLCGQVFFEPPKEELYRQKAKELGVDEEAYLKAIKEVPIVPKERFEAGVELMRQTAMMLAEAGRKRLEHQKAIEALKHAQAKLEETIANQQKSIAAVETAKKHAEDVINAIPVALMILDEQGTIASVNPSLEEMTGYHWKEIVGRRLPEQQFITDEALAASRTMWEEHLKRGENKALGYEVPIRSRSGDVRTLRMSEVRIRDSAGRDTWMYIAEDITELKKIGIKLEETVENQQKIITEATAKLEELVEAQQQTIKELSTPLIPVWSKVLMAPLLGSFDSMRMHDLSERLLEYVASQKPKAVLLDLTGLAHVDTQVISEIVRLIASLRLLGSRAILVGIKPHVAQSLVRLGASLEGVPTHATLEQGLRGLIGDAGHAKR